MPLTSTFAVGVVVDGDSHELETSLQQAEHIY